jgi:hypothetical protein
MEPRTYGPAELAGLPPVVQRYFRTVLTPGQPMITAVRVEHSGTFNVSTNGEKWRPFTSEQRVITRHPGFDWDARIQMVPGVEIRVHDAYIHGTGIMHAAFYGLFTMANLHGRSEMARGQLMRYFAEAAWYPTALLPSQGVTWHRVDDRSARATLSDPSFTLTLLIRFNSDDLIESVRADGRGRTVRGTIVTTPWEGHWRSYVQQDNMLIPMEGEVAWILEKGAKPYWRGRITSLVYEFA